MAGPKGISNYAWLFSPAGALHAEYRKQYLAPPERDYLKGRDYAVREMQGVRYGIAICKDMHFATLGREYGQRKAAVMLVPAWDFYLDRSMGARITAVRGVENGYLVVRTSRAGLLSITDAQRRILAERESRAMPGGLLLATVNVPHPIDTLYTRTGNVLGWLSVAAAAVMIWLGRSSPHR